jgi:hypothetical protein
MQARSGCRDRLDPACRAPATLNVEYGAAFIGHDSDRIDLTVGVDRTEQRAAIACHPSQRFRRACSGTVSNYSSTPSTFANSPHPHLTNEPSMRTTARLGDGVFRRAAV